VTEEPIRLKEYETWTGGLESGDVDFIASKLDKRIAISRHPQDDFYQLNPKQHVGILTLPSGRRIESYPKVDVRNLFYMLSVALGLPSPFPEELTQLDRLDRLFEFVAEYFAGLVERRIETGLYRAYVETEDNRPVVRGRIEFARDLRLNYVLRHRTFCRYAEFTWDIPENQVVRQVVHMLAGWSFQDRLRGRLSRIDAELAEVTPTLMPASAIDRFRYHRLNDDYQPIHQLCRLFLEGASLSEELGLFSFSTFLVDMNRLFELFVTEVLRQRVPRPLSVSSQRTLYLGRGDMVPMRPDISVYLRSVPQLMADCKYKRIDEDEFKNHDVYQLLAYCTAANVARGLLIYPRHLAPIGNDVRVVNTDVTIRQLTIDLGKVGKALDDECDQLVDDVVRWTLGSRVALARTA
jgi:5-methylcytosine-specific restriction enzyme subunit McrC